MSRADGGIPRHHCGFESIFYFSSVREGNKTFTRALSDVHLRLLLTIIKQVTPWLVVHQKILEIYLGESATAVAPLYATHLNFTLPIVARFATCSETLIKSVDLLHERIYTSTTTWFALDTIFLHVMGQLE